MVLLPLQPVQDKPCKATAAARMVYTLPADFFSRCEHSAEPITASTEPEAIVALADIAAQFTLLVWGIGKDAVRPTTRKSTLPAFEVFVLQIIQSTNVEAPIVLIALLYLKKLRECNKSVIAAKGSEYRLFATALLLSNKIMDDHRFTNKAWSMISGICVNELNIMEREFLNSLNYQLQILQQTYTAWVDRIRHFAHRMGYTSSSSPVFTSRSTFLDPYPTPPLTRYTTAATTATSVPLMPVQQSFFERDLPLPITTTPVPDTGNTFASANGTSFGEILPSSSKRGAHVMPSSASGYKSTGVSVQPRGTNDPRSMIPDTIIYRTPLFVPKQGSQPSASSRQRSSVHGEHSLKLPPDGRPRRETTCGPWSNGQRDAVANISNTHALHWQRLAYPSLPPSTTCEKSTWHPVQASNGRAVPLPFARGLD